MATLTQNYYFLDLIWLFWLLSAMKHSVRSTPFFAFANLFVCLSRQRITARKQNGFDLAKNMFCSSCSNEEVEKKKFEHYMFTFQDELDNNIHITYRVSQKSFPN